MMIGKFKHAKLVGGEGTAPTLRPQLNVDPIFDAMTGSYVDGVNGEKILNGGIMNLVAIGGEGNTSKSTIMNSMALRILSRHPSAYLTTYETEGNFTYHRMESLARRYPSLANEDFATGEGRYQLLSTIEIDGDQWHDLVKKQNKERIEDKNALGTSPFLDVKQKGKEKHFKLHYPTLMLVDSLSEFQTGTQKEKMEKYDIDDKDNNTYFMQDGLQKKKLIQDLPKTLPRAGQYVIFTMHKSEKINLGVTPERKNLIYMRQGQKFKGAPKDVEFMTQHCWDIVTAKPLFSSDRSNVLYPSKTHDSSAVTDLIEVSFQGLRNKSGPSGIPISVIVSQSTGVLWDLSHYHFLTNNDYGCERKGHNYYFAFYPEKAFGRTTIRDELDTNPALCRALELQVELAIFIMYRDEFPNQYRVMQADLYKGLVEKGYSWDKILATRGYWLFEEEVAALKELGEVPAYLSALDLVRLYLGEIERPDLKA